MAAQRGLVGVEIDASKVLAKLAPTLYGRAVARFIATVAFTAQRAAQGATPVDMGALRRSITTDVQPLSARVYTPLAYAAAVDQGRRPGARMPPLAAVAAWMHRHGLDGVSPYVVARSIARRGVAGRFFMKAGMKAAADAAPRLLGVAAREIQREWAR